MYIQYCIYTKNIIANTNRLMSWNPDNKNHRFECCIYYLYNTYISHLNLFNIYTAIYALIMY